MSNKITVTTEKDGRDVVFEGSGTLTLIERAGGWVDTRPVSAPSREVRGLEIVWDGIYTVREADTLAELREENRRLDAEADGAISLDGLRAAWESADQADECHEGDTLIEFFAHGAYHVYSAAADYSSLPPAVRILRRAPQPPPWQALAGVLGGWLESPTELAKYLYERGVRVMGGDDGD